MITRDCTKEDFDRIIEIAIKSNFPLPSFKRVMSTKVIEKNGTIIAFGCLQKHVEMTFMPDLYQSNITIGKSLIELNKGSIEIAKSIGIDQLYASVTDKKFQDLLTKHLGYVPSKGTSLYLDI